MHVFDHEELEIPRMFEGLEAIPTPDGRREYIEDELVKMARSKSLCLTHILNQRDPIHHLAADVMVGHGVSDGSGGHRKNQYHTDWPIHEDLEEYRVVICSTDGKDIEYLDGMERIKGIVRSVGRKRHNLLQRRERIRKLKKSKAVLPLRAAIICLQQYGAFVKYAPSESIRRRFWKLVEIHDALPWEEPKKPAKGKTEAA